LFLKDEIKHLKLSLLLGLLLGLETEERNARFKVINKFEQTISVGKQSGLVEC
jgi:hypothetical protein